MWLRAFSCSQGFVFVCFCFVWFGCLFFSLIAEWQIVKELLLLSVAVHFFLFYKAWTVFQVTSHQVSPLSTTSGCSACMLLCKSCCLEWTAAKTKPRPVNHFHSLLEWLFYFYFFFIKSLFCPYWMSKPTCVCINRSIANSSWTTSPCQKHTFPLLLYTFKQGISSLSSSSFWLFPGQLRLVASARICTKDLYKVCLIQL